MRTDEDATFSRRGRGPYVIGAALILGSDELARGVVQLKDFGTGTQPETPIAGLPQTLS